MKFLKWFLIVFLLIIGAVLIIAIFLPKKVTVSAETEIQESSILIFDGVAKFKDRPLWDPWVSTDSTTKVTINVEERYIGTSYEWDGEKVKTGKVVVDSIEFGQFISSSIEFGNQGNKSIVNWEFEENPGGTKVTWSFKADAPYPIGRLYMAIGKSMLQKSYEEGLENLKAYYENNEIHLSTLSELKKVTKPAMFAMVAEASGTMEEVTQNMSELFGAAYQEAMAQGLEVVGPGFGFYYNYDPEQGTTNVQCGFPVEAMGKSGKKVIARSFPEVKCLQAIHTGPYEEFEHSYNKMMEYVQKNQVNITWESFEEYLNDPSSEPYSTLWKTAIYFVLAD